jgi:hypothetical protein
MNSRLNELLTRMILATWLPKHSDDDILSNFVWACIPWDPVLSGVWVPSVWETIVSTCEPDHVASNLSSSVLEVTDSGYVVLWGISSETGENAWLRDSGAGSGLASSIAESAPSSVAVGSIVLSDILQWGWAFVEHDSNSIGNILALTIGIPWLNSNETLRVDLRVSEHWLGDNEVWSQSLELLGEDHQVGSKVFVVSEGILQVKINSIALPLGHLSGKGLSSVWAGEGCLPSLVLTVSVATDGVDDLGAWAEVNGLASVLERGRDDHIVVDEGEEDHIELLDPWAHHWLPVAGGWNILPLSILDPHVLISKKDVHSSCERGELCLGHSQQSEDVSKEG